MTTREHLTAEDFAQIALFVPLLLAQDKHPDQIALAISSLDAQDEELYMAVNKAGMSHDDAVKALSRTSGQLVQQIERDLEAVRRRILIAMISLGATDEALSFFESEIENALKVAKERSRTYVFAVMGTCGDYYCEHEHLVGIFTDEGAAREVAAAPGSLKSQHGHTRCDAMEVVRIPLGEVVPDGSLTVGYRSPGSCVPATRTA